MSDGMIQSGGLRPEQEVEQVVSVVSGMVGAPGEQLFLRGGPITLRLPVALGDGALQLGCISSFVSLVVLACGYGGQAPCGSGMPGAQ